MSQTKLFPTAKLELTCDTDAKALVLIYRYINGVIHCIYCPSDLLLRLNIPGLKNIKVKE